MKMLCLLLTTLFVMLGLTTIYATDNDTGITEVEANVTENMNTHTDNNDISNVMVKKDNTQKQMKEKSAVNQTKNINKNTVSTQTTKTASKTYTVMNSSSLSLALQNYEFTTVTVNIKSDISDYFNSIYAAESIRKITINGNNKVLF